MALGYSEEYVYNMISEANEGLQRVMVLDDNEDVLEMLKELLTGEGYEVKGFSTVTDVIELAEQTQPDLILIDYILSGINGGEYCHQLKHHPQTAHIPVIMLSAHQRVLESLGNYGWDAFVAKPFEVETLVNTIKSLLDNKRENCYTN